MQWRQNFPRARRLLGSLSNDDGDVNENGIKAIGLDWQNNTFFFCRRCTTTTWKCLISRFVEDVNTRQWLFFTFPGLWYSLRIQLQKICQHLTNWPSWNKCDEVWGSANLLFKWRFRSHRRRCCLSALMQEKERMDKLEEDWSGLQLMVFETLLA